MAELFQEKRFLPLNVGENSASYPSSLKKHWFIEVYQETGKMPFLSLLFQFLTEKKKKYWRPHKAGSYSDQSQKSGLLCQDHYFKPVPGALCHLACNKGTETLCLFSIAKGICTYLLNPPPSPIEQSVFLACTFSQEYQNSKLWKDLSPSVRKVTQVRWACPTSLQREGRVSGCPSEWLDVC